MPKPYTPLDPISIILSNSDLDVIIQSGPYSIPLTVDLLQHRFGREEQLWRSRYRRELTEIAAKHSIETTPAPRPTKGTFNEISNISQY